MGRGYPDFFGYPIAPNYGVTTTSLHANKVLGPFASYDLLDLDIKGRIMGGKLACVPDSVSANQYIDVYLDGVRVDQICALCEDESRYHLTNRTILKPIRIDHGSRTYEYWFEVDTLVNYNLTVTMVNAELVVNYMASITLFYNGYEAD